MSHCFTMAALAACATLVIAIPTPAVGLAAGDALRLGPDVLQRALINNMPTSHLIHFATALFCASNLNFDPREARNPICL
jgi:hypothetical protein